MNAPALALPASLRMPSIARVRELFRGGSFPFIVNSFVILGWSADNLLYSIPTYGLAMALQREVPSLLESIWLVLPIQPAITVILNGAPAAGWRRLAHILLALALALGWCEYWGFTAFSVAGWPSTWVQRREVVGDLLQTAFLPGCFIWAFVYHRSAARIRNEAGEAERRAAKSDAELQRARLALLRAQIEPHFLFNTLANAQSLLRSDREAGLELLARINQYFTAALPGLREEETTLAEEFEWVDAYLAIHRVRMGDRLDHAVQLPAELRDVRIPTMAVLTLVENALKHGIGPSRDGGAIHVTAMRRVDAVEVAVEDSGVGFVAESGRGNGLANTRTRLRLAHGTDATLTLASVAPRGTVARLRLPIRSG